MTITHDGVTIETIPDTGWAISYLLGNMNVHVAPDLPPFASPELRETWLGFMVAGAEQHCRTCDAVSPIPTEAKTAPEWSAVITKGNDIHTADCPYSEANFYALVRAENPFPDGLVADTLSGADAERAMEYLADVCERLVRASTGPDTLT